MAGALNGRTIGADSVRMEEDTTTGVVKKTNMEIVVVKDTWTKDDEEGACLSSQPCLGA